GHVTGVQTCALPIYLQLAGRPAQLADEALRLAAGLVGNLRPRRAQLLGALAFELGNMTTFTAAGQPSRLIEKAELHGVIAIVLRSEERRVGEGGGVW